jgi:hypothetical protein
MTVLCAIILFHFPDIDECYLGTFDCIPEAMCENTVGSYMCACLPGYAGNGTVCEGESAACLSILVCGQNEAIQRSCKTISKL